MLSEITGENAQINDTGQVETQISRSRPNFNGILHHALIKPQFTSIP